MTLTTLIAAAHTDLHEMIVSKVNLCDLLDIEAAARAAGAWEAALELNHVRNTKQACQRERIAGFRRNPQRTS